MDNKKIKFSIIIVEIIEEYFKQLLNDKNINHELGLSIKEDDLRDNSIKINSTLTQFKYENCKFHLMKASNNARIYYFKR